MRELSTTQLIVLGFLSAIFIGAILLCLPISSASGEATPFLDALFTSTTSVCVTGLVVLDTFSYWNLFGQMVILFLIQCGGLGIISFTTAIMLVIGRKVTLKDRLVLEDAFNLNTLSGLVRFLQKVLKGTFLVEGIGAICYAFVFVPQFGWAKGIWFSIFNAVSAFCNAGIDIIGNTSLMPYVTNVTVNIVTMLLIILGGLGFIVWWDVIRVLKLSIMKEIHSKQIFWKLSLHSKIVLVTTAGLILAGAVIILGLEYYNPLTLGNLSFGNKVMASFFQSVTTRTAGFMTISQAGLSDAAGMFCMILMFIGGSPAGTAGGIKTTSIAMILLATVSLIKGQGEVVAFRRSIPLQIIRKALAVTFISVIVTFGSIMVLLAFEQGSFLDIAYETVSAIGTVGLSRNFTLSLDAVGKIVIIICMYLGRIGPISMAIAFGFKKGKKGRISMPEENITVG